MSEKEQIAIREIEDILNNDVYILPKGAILYPLSRHGYIRWLPKLTYLHPGEFEIKDVISKLNVSLLLTGSASYSKLEKVYV